MNVILFFVILFIGTIIFSKTAHFVDRRIPRAGLILSPILCSWSFLCVYLTKYFTDLSTVTWDWIYWILGIGFCVSLPAAIFGESASNKNATAEELSLAGANVKINRGSVLFGLAVALRGGPGGRSQSLDWI
jgi:hypothetical protein